MNTHKIAFSLAAFLIACVPAMAAQKATPEANLVNTGSTNTLGYQITVTPTGHASYRPFRLAGGGTTQTGHISKTLAQQLFRDIKAAEPLDQLPVHRVFKSISFGTSTYIEYNGVKTPDLSAPADSRGQALLTDIQTIAAALNLKNSPRHPVGPPVPSLP